MLNCRCMSAYLGKPLLHCEDTGRMAMETLWIVLSSIVLKAAGSLVQFFQKHVF